MAWVWALPHPRLKGSTSNLATACVEFKAQVTEAACAGSSCSQPAHRLSPLTSASYIWKARWTREAMQPSCCPCVCKPFSTLVNSHVTASASSVPDSTWGRQLCSGLKGGSLKAPAPWFVQLIQSPRPQRFIRGKKRDEEPYLFEERPAELCGCPLAGQSVLPGQGVEGRN